MREEKKKVKNLCTVVPYKIATNFEIEVVKRCGQSYGNMSKCLIEAITDWIKKPQKK